MSNRYYIPNTLESGRWPRRLNPHYLEIKEASAAWLKRFEAFSPGAQYAFGRCDFGLVACLAYPSFSKEHLRTVCDLINLLFVYDAYTDVALEDDVRVMADISMDALRNPHAPRPKDEWIGGEITRQFWELAIKTASPGSQKHFIETYEAYTQSIVQEAVDRIHRYIRTVYEYMELRRVTVGAMPCFAMLRLGLNLPDDVVLHPIVNELSALATDMILLANDMTSYNIEQARDDDNHNIITTLMHHNKTDVQGAMSWVSSYHKSLVAKFMDIYETVIPKFGSEPVDTELATYMDAIGNWVRANDQWNFKSERYFGKKGPEIQKTRWVTLLPKKPLEEVGPELVDGSLL